MLNCGSISQQMVLHAHLQREMVLTIFNIFFLGGEGGNHIQQLIILKVVISISSYRNKVFAVLKQ